MELYSPNLYQNKTEEEIREMAGKLGFDPVKIHDAPGRVYHPHSHKETKLLAFLEGSMKVKVDEEEFDCSAGDQLIIPGGVKHSAVVGEQGCTFFWSEKIMEKLN